MHLVPAANGVLCEVIEGTDIVGISQVCGEAPRPGKPATMLVTDPDERGKGIPVFIVGAAIDGATSITITINGSQVEVPIENNAHGYQAPPDVVATDVTGAVVNFADGHKEEAN